MHMGTAHGAVIEFSDTEFQNGDWSGVEVRDTTPNNSFVFNAGQQLAGGNRHENSTSLNPDIYSPANAQAKRAIFSIGAAAGAMECSWNRAEIFYTKALGRC